MKIISLALILLLPLFSLAENGSDGHSVGNGGGVICINGKCQTLTESGMQVSPEYDGVWLPESDHYRLVEVKVEKELLLNDELRQKIYMNTFGRADHFRKVDVVDPGKLELIKKEYEKIAQQSGFPFDPNTFQIVAVSSDDTVKPAMTYLLPAFFDLSVEQQANILFHEGLYRGRPTSELKYVLQLESSMHQMIEQNYNCSTEKNQPQIKPCVNQQIIGFRLGFIRKAELIGYIFSLVDWGLKKGDETSTHRFSNIVSLALFGELKIDENKDGHLLIDNQRLVSIAKLEPRLPYMFSKVDSIALKFKKTEQFWTKDHEYLSVNWRKSSDLEIHQCSKSGAHDYSACDIYSIANPEDIPLLLPD